jgi:HSP20 family protein
MAKQLATERPFGDMAGQMNRMIDQLSKGYFNFCPSETWTPNVNLYETPKAYMVCVDLAGVDKGKIHLEVIDGRLTLKGTRAVPMKSKKVAGGKVRIHLMEIDHGQFVRQVELPEDVRAEKIAASFRDGMLWIDLPKKVSSRQ